MTGTSPTMSAFRLQSGGMFPRSGISFMTIGVFSFFTPCYLPLIDIFLCLLSAIVFVAYELTLIEVSSLLQCLESSLDRIGAILSI